MNNVTIIGRLTADPEIRNTGETQIANFSLALDRPPRKDGTKETDFPRCVAFGKTADFVGNYCKKGARAAVQGRIQTGRYENKDGVTVYTTDVVAERVELIDWPEKDEQQTYPQGDAYGQGYPQQPQQYQQPQQGNIYSGGFGQPGINAQPQQQDFPGTYNNPFEGDPGYQYGRR